MSASVKPPGFCSLMTFTVTRAVFESLPYCAVTFTSPPLSPTAVTTPFSSTVATELLSTYHFAETLSPFERRSKSSVLPTPFVTMISPLGGVISSVVELPPTGSKVAPSPPTPGPFPPAPAPPLPPTVPSAPLPQPSGTAAKSAAAITSKYNQALRIGKASRPGGYLARSVPWHPGKFPPICRNTRRAHRTLDGTAIHQSVTFACQKVIWPVLRLSMSWRGISPFRSIG